MFAAQKVPAAQAPPGPCPVGVTLPVVAASSLARTDPTTAAARILGPEGLEGWFEGARVVATDAAWPAAGSRMAWTVGRARWRFEAQVVEDRRPASVAMAVRTPSGTSRITHRFEPAAGGTRYTKEVDFTPGNRFTGAVMTWGLRRWVRAEVDRAAALASA